MIVPTLTGRIQYFKVIKSRRDYKGIRYFKFDLLSDKVIQVTINQGEVKKGRAKIIGIGLIAKITFMTNYLSFGYVEACSKEEYDESFKQVVKMLK